MHATERKRIAGFTLIEMIVVIVITGIIGGMVAVFIRAPIQAYFDSVRRAELSDIADTVMRRISRDVRLALPNSLRNPADSSSECVEFIPTKTGGRYRVNPQTDGSGDALDFTTTDSSFDMLGLNSDFPVDSRMAVGDVVVVFNTESCDAASCTGNAYRGNNAMQVASLGNGGTANTTAIGFVDAATASPFNRKQLPGASPFSRFQVIPANEHVVAFVCDSAGTSSGSGTGTLYRYRRTLSSAYARPATCAAMAAGATAATLATNLSSCSLHYEAPGSSTGLGNYGLLIVTFEIAQNNELIRLYHQIHVDGTP